MQEQSGEGNFEGHSKPSQFATCQSSLRYGDLTLVLKPHAFNTFICNTHCVLRDILSAGEAVVDITCAWPHGADVLIRNRDNKQVSKIRW